MEIQTLSGTFSVSPQIQPCDMTAIYDAGFRGIICNRPDGEAVDQPAFEEIERVAKHLGIKARYVPIVPGMQRDEDLEDFVAALDALPRPVLAYCRSGARSTMMWSLSQGQNNQAATAFAGAAAEPRSS
ncbi:MAG: TIGR01244 family sulfur transferase [Pseudomonadota bacterium]